MNTEILEEIGKRNLQGSDFEFFKRVWTTDLSKYTRRLENIGFSSGQKILDAGCGTGQWSICMTDLYNEVYAVDIHAGRINALKELASYLGKSNLHTDVSGIEEMNFPDESFDAIFCYSAIFFTDPHKTISTFSRLLKTGGRVYINANGLGWYLHNLVNTHNSSASFDSRKMAVETLENTLGWHTTGIKSAGQLCITSAQMRSMLELNNCRIVASDGDGLINLSQKNESISFFQKNYFEKEGVYEVLAEKL